MVTGTNKNSNNFYLYPRGSKIIQMPYAQAKAIDQIRALLPSLAPPPPFPPA